MLVVEAFVLAQGVPKMAFVPYEAAVEKLVTARLHPVGLEYLIHALTCRALAGLQLLIVTV
ncbi:hypothetical protein ACIHFD_04010 [Nonomuraea sp. NPDC051941]|uniref:hypothetical protein n=1 Tax=Nonomuraea sp. NPDC051941 TaxID=3364373 RepID=UPI0037CC19A4